MSSAEQYGYSVSRLRAMSGLLLEDSLIQRILESENLDAALKTLGETSYAHWIGEQKGSLDFDRVIEQELLYVYREVGSFLPDPGLVQLCRLPYDFHNVKVLLKSMILVREGGERRFDLLTPLGNIDGDTLIMAVETEEYRLLPFGLHSIVPAALSLWEQTKDILAVEKMLDTNLFEGMRTIACSTGIEAAEQWVSGRIDAENLRNLLRLKRVGMDLSEVPSFLHDGGFISKEKLLSLVAEPVESWSRTLSFSDAGSAFSRLDDFSDFSALIVTMERLLDEYVCSILERTKYEAFEPGYILLFLWKKEMEAKNLRIALVSVANDTNRSAAKELLRHG